jgi:nucleotide-binding universal stress UspA family protein
MDLSGGRSRRLPDVSRCRWRGWPAGPGPPALPDGGRPPERGTSYAMSGVSRVIVGVSGSPGSLHALRYAEALARAHDAVLIPVVAWTPPGGDGAGRYRLSGQLREVWREIASQRLRDALLAVWGEAPCHTLVQPHVEHGPAGCVLVSLAGDSGDVLVVGAGRRGVLARLLCRGLRGSPRDGAMSRKPGSQHLCAAGSSALSSRCALPCLQAVASCGQCRGCLDR